MQDKTENSSYSACGYPLQDLTRLLDYSDLRAWPDSWFCGVTPRRPNSRATPKVWTRGQKWRKWCRRWHAGCGTIEAS